MACSSHCRFIAKSLKGSFSDVGTRVLQKEGLSSASDGEEQEELEEKQEQQWQEQRQEQQQLKGQQQQQQQQQQCQLQTVESIGGPSMDQPEVSEVSMPGSSRSTLKRTTYEDDHYPSELADTQDSNLQCRLSAI